MVACVTQACQVLMPMADLVDLDKERERLEKELENAENMVKRTQAKLQNESFVSRAPQNVVDAEKEKLQKYGELAEKLRASIQALQA